MNGITIHTRSCVKRFWDTCLLVLLALSINCLSFVHTVHAASVSLTLGDLVITEIMANPTGISDSQGEWIEVFNNSAAVHQGLTLMDGGASNVLDFGGSFLLAPGDFATLARSTGPGGFTPDALFSVSLNNSGDSLTLLDGVLEVARFLYTGGSVSDGSSTSVNLFAPAGPSWAINTLDVYDLSNTGTPGVTNPSLAGEQLVEILPLASVPIPTTVWLFGSALGLLGWIRYRTTFELTSKNFTS